MRSFAAIVLFFLACLVLAAVLAYPAWLVVEQFAHQPIHRVMHRVAMLSAILGLVWIFRRWHLVRRHDAGFGRPRREFWQQLAIGILAGAIIILPLLVALQTIGVRVPDTRIDLTPGLVVTVICKGLFTGLAVAFIEEIFFRGYLYAAIERESGRAMALLLPSLLYAALHFLDGRLRVPADQITWSSGLAVFTSMFDAYAEPARIVDSFLALFAVGSLLAVARARTGGIGLSIGMHAAWVCSLYYFEVTTQFNPASQAHWLVGSYDHVVGWATVVWMALMGGVYVMVSRTAQPATAHAETAT
jgi:membrane protease YdiL (CAAX protease family)